MALTQKSSSTAPYEGSWRFSVAPMMDWTDRHCRFFHRLLSKKALLYTEMVTTGALLHGDKARHLDFSCEEHPLALQMGGSEPAELAACAVFVQAWGYDEINLNCGCPSERVQRGAFGACLMAEPNLVADCVKAMRDAVDIPVTVKHRIGLDKSEDYGFLRDFVGAVAEAGCATFVVHARNAWLKGLSPKANREVPPLRYEVLTQLRSDFPALTFVLNGGLTSHAAILAQTQETPELQGVMLGRAAYHEPYMLAEVDKLYFGGEAPSRDLDSIQHRAMIVEQLCEYASNMQAKGAPPRALTRHTLGLFHGLPGGRLWRYELSAGPHAGSDAVAAFRAGFGAVAKHQRLAA